MRPEKEIVDLLIKSKKTLSIAESCTGGLVSDRITNIPGSSFVLKLGIVAYSNQAKTGILKVPPKILKKHGAVSAPVARQMACGVRKIFKTDFGIGITGIAGPGGATARKPVGLTFIALSSLEKTVCIKSVFKGTRAQIKAQAASTALNLLLNAGCEFLISMSLRGAFFATKQSFKKIASQKAFAMTQSDKNSHTALFLKRFKKHA